MGWQDDPVVSDAPAKPASPAQSAPRGLRNNNPGNLNFVGQEGATREQGPGGRFAVFDTPESGLRALASQLYTYEARGNNSVRGMLSKFAPPGENNTKAYIATVSRRMGVSPDQRLDLAGNTKNTAALMNAIVQYENGRNPFPAHVVEAASAPKAASRPFYAGDEVVAPDTKASAAPKPTAKPQPPANPSGGGVLGGVWQGFRDQLDAGAQLLRHAVPDSVGNALDSADRYLGNKIPGLKFAPTDETVARVNAEYDAARKAAGREGVDIARGVGNVVGMVANPVNKLIPPGATALGRVGSAVAQGAVGGALTPVADASNGFAGQKLGQIALGGVTGGVVGSAANALAPRVASAVDAARAKVSPNGAPSGVLSKIIGKPSADSAAAVTQEARSAASGNAPSATAIDRLNSAASSEGVQLQPEVLESLRQRLTKSLATGKDLDPKALVRQAAAEDVLGPDARLTAGQAARDPSAFAREQNLRGIDGVGEPMLRRMEAQNNALISAVRGSGPLPDAYEAGGTALNALAGLDKQKAAQVSAAYRAFRESSGARADVPFAPIANKFQAVMDDFGSENVPSAIVKRVGSYMDSTGTKQTKVFDLDEANKLLTQINAHYDPAKPAQQAALRQIKGALQSSIDDAAQAAPEGADSLRTAIGLARDRFALHDAVPAMADVAHQSQSAREKFVRDYVMGGSVDQVSEMVKHLDPQALESVRGAVRRQILESAAPGAEFGRESATLSQAALRRALDRIGPRKLQALFGGEDASKLAHVQQIAEWIQKAPVGAAVNHSNTAAAMANLLQKVPGGGAIGVPLKMAQGVIKRASDESAVRNALAGGAKETVRKASAQDIAAVRPYLNHLALPAGAAAASLLR